MHSLVLKQNAGASEISSTKVIGAGEKLKCHIRR